MKASTFTVMLLTTAVFSCEEKPAHPEADKAIQACQKGFEAIASANLQPGDRATVLAHACKGLFLEPVCRKAWEEFESNSPEERSNTMMDSCRRAYCPKFPEPKPKACAMKTPPSTSHERILLWSELQWAILSHDLGPKRAAGIYAKFLLFQTIHFKIEVELPRLKGAQTTPAEATLLVTVDESGTRVVLDGEEKSHWTLPPRPKAADFRPILDALKGSSDKPKVIIFAETNVPYSAVVAVMDVLHEAGLEQFSLATTEAE